MKTEMKELELNELEQASGGFVWVIPVAIAVVVGIGTVIHVLKNKK